MATTPPRSRLPTSTDPQPGVIQRFVRVVPDAVWLALAGALLLAALAGDRLLCAAARLLQESVRSGDVVGRLGGDEMGLLLVEQTPEGARAATRRIESEVLLRRDSLGLHAPWDLTVGTSSFPADGETGDELLRTADQRLYEQRGIELRDAGSHEITARAAQPGPS